MSDTVTNMFKSGLKDSYKDAFALMTSNDRGFDETSKLEMSKTNDIRSIADLSEEEYDEFFEEIKKEETKEATGASSSGGFEAPLFSEPKKNNLFQPGTESKLTTKPEGGFVKEDKIPGGLADDMTLEDLAKHHDTTIDEIIDRISDGINVEMEHTSDTLMALEIALDHIYEDLNYYDKLEKIEAKEATTSASVGAYDAPIGGGRKDPLQIDTPKSVYNKLRSVKDPNFPKYGGPGGTYVRVKDKCKKFPYCNQGDIKALEFFENNLVKESVKDVLESYNLENSNIYYKNNDMNKEIENMIDGIVQKVLSEEIVKKVNKITQNITESGIERRNSDLEGELEEEDLSEDAFNFAAAKAALEGKKEFEFGGETHPVEMDKTTAEKIAGKNESTKNTITLSEEEIIDFIEKIVKEEKIEGIKSQDSAMKQSKKDTDDYMKDFMKKFKEYLKDGSEGSFDTEPKNFPKGNGELKKMEKMAYTPSKGVEEYIDQIARSGGMENLEYDQIKPNEDWLDANIVGSSKTGNSDEYANAVPTDVNKRVKKRKEDNILAKLKAQSYNRVPQPVTDFAGHHTNDEEFAGIQVSENKKQVKINEDLERMKKLFSHNYKSQ